MHRPFAKTFALSAATLGLVWTMGVVGAGAASAHGVRPPRPVIQDGHTCTVVGTAGNDNLVGHAGDVVCGLGGNDTLTAVGAGTIILIGGKGNDKLVGSTTPVATDILN